jgi:hypothetical protein
MLLLAVPTRAQQQQDFDTWAKKLVDSEALGAGDLDGAIAEWLSMVRAQPGHPLAEGTLRLVGLMQERAADPAAVAKAVLALPAQGLTPLGARQLAVLQGQARATRLPVSDPPADAFPGWLAHAFVLGPLKPLGHPLAARDPSPEFGDPGFGAPHAGVDGDVRWAALDRHPLSRTLAPAEAFEPARGWALVDFVFDVPECGFGWIEIGQRRAGSALPPYALVINDEPPIVVEHLHDDAPPVERTFAVLRTGRNRLLLKCSLDSQPEFGVRVLDESGLPWPGLVEVRDLKAAGAPLGRAACFPATGSSSRRRTASPSSPTCRCAGPTARRCSGC